MNLKNRFLVVVLLSTSVAVAQGHEVSQGTPVTLWMDWVRGDSNYGKDFIELHRPCEGKSCMCVAAFKVISRKENAKEFANYISSFEQGKVPVVYELVLSKEGRFVGANLLRVGDWTRDKFDHNDGLLGVRVRFNAADEKGRSMRTSISSPGDCFPHPEQGKSGDPARLLFDRATTAMQERRFSVANITLQTLVNTYPESQYAGRAKLMLQTPEIARCGGVFPITPNLCEPEESMIQSPEHDK